MVSQRALAFTADLDISDVSRGLRRIEQQSRRAGASVGRVGAGVGRAVSAGAGIGAGAAIFEMLFQKVFEIFEGTPILVTFTAAIDELLKAFGPVIGVLLQSLLPAIVALTPAIEPLARAIVPLIELLGTGLLVAVQLMVPYITFMATQLEVATTFVRDFVTNGIEFLVSQLNKLPFVDIELEIDKTGNSFDSMAGQIAAAGDDSVTAEGKVKGLAGAVKEVEDTSRTGADVLADFEQAQMDAETATDVLRLGIGANTKTTNFATLAYEANQKAADELTASLTAQGIAMGEGRQEADLLTLSLGAVRMGFSNAPHLKPRRWKAKIIEQMTFQDYGRHQGETELEEMALASLNLRSLIESARLLGLFGLEVASVGQAAEALASGIGGQRPGRPNWLGRTVLSTLKPTRTGQGSPGVPAPGPRYLSDIAQDEISQVYTDENGKPFAFNTTGGGNTQFNIFEVGRLEDALAFLARQAMMAAPVVEMTAAATEMMTAGHYGS